VGSANVEIGGMAGVHVFSEDSELGVDDLPESHSPSNSVLLGLRVGTFFGHVVGVEGEVGLIPTSSRELGYSVTGLTYRAHLVAQFRAADPDARLIPFVVAGGGALGVIASSPQVETDPRQITKDTDAMLYGGVGLKYRGGTSWGVRGDARLISLPSTDNPQRSPTESKSTLDVELMVSGYLELGRARHRPPLPPKPVDDDPDKDGVRGAADKCPEPEDVDGFEDDDGCPDPDNDGDKVADAVDKCPEREDIDGFEDGDGCPDPDNDHDQIADASDRCPLVAENVNSYEDEDGCPDTIPRPTLDQILKTFTDRILFEYDKAVLTPESNRVIGEVANLLKATPEIELLSIEGHSSRDGEARRNEKLSQERAQATADALIASGVEARRLQVLHFGAKKPVAAETKEAQRRLSRRVEFKVVKFNASAPAAPSTR
ncbi:MAG: OmpA family protein, partial [Myxococcales bacterium]|nr:OmpA family protein [Myxococcales bacterium]